MKLPPDPDNMNEARADWGNNAICQMMGDTGTDRPDALSDLLCDLMHWCDREHGIDFETELVRARAAYASETTEDLT